MTIILVLILTVLSATFYRMGGSGNYPRQARMVGCSVATTLAIGLLLGFSWWLILHLGILCGTLSTYWKKKGSDAEWWNWLLTGLGYSIAALPIAIVYGDWIGFAIRTVVLSLGVMFWSEKMDNVVWEECGRGALLVLTTPLLLL